MEEKILARGVFSSNTRGIKLAIASIVCFSILFLVSLLVVPFICVIFLGWIIYDVIQIIRCHNTKNQVLVITNKRVYGSLEGKNIELPLDKISHIETIGNKRLKIATASGSINCMQCENRDEMVQIISKLLEKRNTPNVEPPVVSVSKHQPILVEMEGSDNPKSDYEKLKEYKQLLDEGILTQEEFDIKKKEILGISLQAN